MTQSFSRGPALRPSERGATAQFACTADPRFSFCLYVPDSYDESAHDRWPLLVVVHGTLRNSQAMRDAFARFAQSQRVIVLTPLFPAGIGEYPADVHNYKFISYRGIRYDEILLSMIEQISRRYRLVSERFMLFGFSGGGQFVHRFFYLHAAKLLAVSIGAPGVVTLLDRDQPWWVGIGDVREKFGIEPDPQAMRAVKVQMIIGADDTDADEVTVEPSSPLYMPGANDAGANRVDRLRTLAGNFEKSGIPVRFDRVPGVAHQEPPELLERVEDFFSEVLAAARGAA